MGKFAGLKPKGKVNATLEFISIAHFYYIFVEQKM